MQKQSRKSTPKAGTRSVLLATRRAHPPTNHRASSVEMSTDHEKPLLRLSQC
ncbi:uncharacterized protein BO95DRAFT_442786 [Aspergillus brunneoviolaceus CBS 621.78]|uniref:Uncharacterized protein n=1 Tax=Aspergillus brunneoviolaceus CBS 621.78 TaxID=1450534 RepID=A0ACD1G8U7_9EURO|nr:hypothetical protein BO95DRAFT_442786 [Aspergillus brunneoviolaceus CBS 621.78]RAH45668.1 hypothetical protein BO95DRAFT_442786 [Aspergillus brunneoviolaceus CBS 621.78]